MTSGALMPTWIFDKLGRFASEYFIDQVDIEYCYRIRAAGYLVADSRNVSLSHSPGQPATVRLLGFTFRPTFHSAVRRYYITRNRIAVYRKYFGLFPKIIIRSMYFELRESVKCLLLETERVRKLRNTLRGIWDGVSGHMGMREGL